MSENTLILFVCVPKFSISIVFFFSWDHCKSQKKLETMLTQNLGTQTKSIRVFFEVAYFFLMILLWKKLTTSSSHSMKSKCPSIWCIQYVSHLFCDKGENCYNDKMHNLIFKLTSVALSGLDSTVVFCSIVDFGFLACCVFICAYVKYLPEDVFFKPLSSAVTCGRIPQPIITIKTIQNWTALYVLWGFDSVLILKHVFTLLILHVFCPPPIMYDTKKYISVWHIFSMNFIKQMLDWHPDKIETF